MSIRTRIILAALAVVATITVASVVYTIDRERRAAVGRLYDTVRENARLLTVVTPGPLYDGNITQLNAILDTLFANPDVLEIALKETRGDIALARRRAPARAGGERIGSRIRVLRGSDELGTVRVAYTTANIEQRLTDSRNTVVLFSLLLMGVLSGVFYWLASRLVRPIEHLTDAAREIAAGHLEREIDTRGAAEMAVLGQSFVQMRNAVREKMADLAENNRRLREEIEQRRQAEQERDRIASIMEATSDMVGMAGADGTILYLNHAGQSMLGIGFDTVDLHAVISDVHPRWASELILREGVPTAIRDGVWSGETAVLHRDGREIPVSQVILSHKDAQGNLLYLSTIMRDMTERRKVEEALRASEERLSIIFYRTPIAFAVTRFSDARFLDVNDAWLNLLGYTREGLLGRTALEIGLYDDRGDHGRLIERLSGRQFLNDFVVWLRRGDGQRTLCELSLNVTEIGGEQCLIWSVRDITERMRAEQALRVSDERLRQAVRVAGTGIFDHDQIAETIYWSPEQRRIYGVGPDDPVTLQVFLDHVFSGDLDRISAAVARAHNPASDGRFDVEHRIVRSDGIIRWVVNRAQTFFEGEGEQRRPVRTIGAVSDITERRQAEETRALLASIVETSSDAIISRELDGKVSSWNAAAERMFGCSAAEALGRDIGFIIPTDRQAEAAEKRAMIERGAPVQSYDTALLGKNGRIDVSATQSPIRDESGALIGVSLTFHDIAERKRAEQALRESEAKISEAYATLDDAIESAPAAIAVYDAEDKLVTFNSRFRALVSPDPGLVRPGVEFATLARKFIDSGRVAGPQRTGEDWLESRARGPRDPSRSFEVEMTDGRWLQITETQTRTGGVVTVYSDISALKEREAELRRLNEELERKVAERTTELEAANKELEAFVYSVSHDLRAPLRAIDGFSQVVVTQYGAELDAEALRMLDRVRAAAQRMGRLIADLLELSRLARSALRRTEVDLSELARAVIEDLSGEAAGRVVEWCIEPGMKVHGDPGLLRVALVNLLSNALKYTRDSVPARIELGTVRRHDRFVEFFVRDNGAGFDMAYAARLFQPFQRLHSRHEFEGTGIGLATVQRVVAKHGGTIRGEGCPGAGATFYFTLPA
jgi:PAS domain S-box-containing protein